MKTHKMFMLLWIEFDSYEYDLYRNFDNSKYNWRIALPRELKEKQSESLNSRNLDGNSKQWNKQQQQKA